MSLLIKGAAGITKLSELTIDADKDWGAFGITNLKSIAAGMVSGDTVYRGATILQRLAKSTLDYFLSQGVTYPFWNEVPKCLVEVDMACIMGALGIASTPDFENFAKQCKVGSSNAEAIVSVDQSHNKDAPIASSYTTSLA